MHIPGVAHQYTKNPLKLIDVIGLADLLRIAFDPFTVCMACGIDGEHFVKSSHESDLVVSTTKHLQFSDYFRNNRIKAFIVPDIVFMSESARRTMPESLEWEKA
jgi:hypothetical protein